MIANFVKWCFSVATVPPAERPALYLEGTYSAFSGIVGNVRLGTPGQMLRVSLSFTDETSVMFSPSHCPPLIGACFHPEISASVHPVSDPTGFFIDGVSIGAHYIENFPFFVPHSRAIHTVGYREVAGVVALAKQVHYAQGLRLALEESSELGDNKVLIQLDTADGIAGMVFPTLDPTNQWIIDAGMRVNQIELPSFMFGGIHYDPAKKGLAFPWSMRGVVISALGGSGVYVSPKRQVFVDCRSDIQIVISGPSGEIALTSRLLLQQRMVSALLPDGPQMVCQSRIRFTDDVGMNSVLIGRLLTRSVRRVVLDYPTRTVEVFPRHASELLEPYSDPLPMVEVFGEPVVERRLGNNAIVAPTLRNRWSTGLILMNSFPLPWTIPGFEPDQAMIFRRIRKTGVPERFTRLLSGMNGYTVRFDVERAVLLPSGRGDFEFWKYESPDVIAIVYRRPRAAAQPPALRYEDFDLPEATIGQPNPEPEVIEAELKFNEPCAICHEEMAVGNRIQGINGCDHKYHEHCLRGWLLSEGPKNCPTCRNEIHRRRLQPREPQKPQPQQQVTTTPHPRIFRRPFPL
jgi:hypothetical protein